MNGPVKTSICLRKHLKCHISSLLRNKSQPSGHTWSNPNPRSHLVREFHPFGVFVWFNQLPLHCPAALRGGGAFSLSLHFFTSPKVAKIIHRRPSKFSSSRGSDFFLSTFHGRPIYSWSKADLNIKSSCTWWNAEFKCCSARAAENCNAAGLIKHTLCSLAKRLLSLARSLPL